MEIRITKHKYDKNFDEEEYCIGCLTEFFGTEDCIKFNGINGGEQFMCLPCFEEYKELVNSVGLDFKKVGKSIPIDCGMLFLNHRGKCLTDCDKTNCIYHHKKEED